MGPRRVVVVRWCFLEVTLNHFTEGVEGVAVRHKLFLTFITFGFSLTTFKPSGVHMWPQLLLVFFTCASNCAYQTPCLHLIGTTLSSFVGHRLQLHLCRCFSRCWFLSAFLSGVRHCYSPSSLATISSSMLFAS